ncbi:MAG: hypothetical protein ABI867_05180 [Kofleriaceae bacterium]
MALTVDWEGAYFSPDGLDALDDFRRETAGVPITHFVSSAYFTKPRPDSTTVVSLSTAIRTSDELAVHLHAWKSLVQASGIEPKLSPSFLTGTDTLLEFDGDAGFDTDLDVYEVPELRALLRTSARLLETIRTPVSRTFRAGGYLGTPKMLQAVYEEGFVVDSSATDRKLLEEQQDGVLPQRIEELWPKVEPMTQPFAVDVVGGQLLEMPIAGIADYVSVEELVGMFESAYAQLQAEPGRDVFVVLGFHQETAHEFANRIVEALAAVRRRPELNDELIFVTMERAASLRAL